MSHARRHSSASGHSSSATAAGPAHTDFGSNSARADMIFTQREVNGTGSGPDMVFTEAEANAQ